MGLRFELKHHLVLEGAAPKARLMGNQKVSQAGVGVMRRVLGAERRNLSPSAEKIFYWSDPNSHEWRFTLYWLLRFRIKDRHSTIECIL